MDRNIELRKNVLKNCRQIVVKAGTRLLTSSEQIARLVDEIAYLRKNNFRVMLVTSGAVGMGMKVLGLTKRPRKLAEVQALAAVGQGKLMEIYERECARHGIKSAQLLLTASDLRSRTRYLNVMNCINALWENDVLPIVNENDSVSVDELKFGDNDILSAMLGSLTGSQLTVILTTESGLRERDAEGNLLPDADRLTPVGKFVRSTSIDELPQLINILKGDMAFIGPRPLLVKYLPLYNEEQRRRHDVTPGMSGWAQVNGRNNISWKKKFEYDVYYVDHIGAAMDIKVFFTTIKKVLFREDINQESGTAATMEAFDGTN